MKLVSCVFKGPNNDIRTYLLYHFPKIDFLYFENSFSISYFGHYGLLSKELKLFIVQIF